LIPLVVRAQDPPKSVLLVYSGERDVAGYSAGRLVSGAAVVDLALERILRTRLGGNLYHYSEYVDTTRLGDPAYVKDVQNLLRSKYEGRQLDVIFVFGDVAVDFISKHRADFFPAIPVVFSAVDPVVSMPNSTGIVNPISQRKVLDTALRVQPDTRHVAIVAGTTAYDRYYVSAAREEFKPYEGRLTFTYLTGLPMRELLSRVATLPAHSIILFMGVTEDGDGRLFLPQEMLDSISAAANAPTYGWNGIGMDHGLVGGTVYSPEIMAVHMAGLGLRLMSGESAETIPVTEIDFSTTQFDWRQLQRWNISESRLPANSTILFRPPSAWESYRAYILGGGLILILQTALIVGLVVQRVRRRRVELALRQSYEQNQDLAGRLINAQEDERARIARDLHDDLSQQLAGVSIMLSGLKSKVGKSGSEPEIDHTVRTLQDRTSTLAESVRNLSHELHPAVLEHTGLVATLRRHCSDIERLHDLSVRFNAGDNLEWLRPDLALCLFRVAQETLTNAVRHGDAHTICVSLTTTADSVELNVVDDGVGFVASERTRSGLGLRSIDERVRFMQGSVSVDSRPGEGTKVLVRIPIPSVA
jgi:signal transduction histidine kinase